MAENEQVSFLGRGWAFPPAFDKATGTTVMAEEVTDIQQSLEILLSTRIGERLLEPRFGCNLERFLFEPLDTTLRTYIHDIIRDAVLYFEPRIIMEGIELTPMQLEGRVDIKLEYFIPSVNSRTNLVYPFYLDHNQNLASMIGEVAA